MSKFRDIGIHIREAIDFSGTYDGWVECEGKEIAVASAATWQEVYDLLGRALDEHFGRDERESNP